MPAIVYLSVDAGIDFPHNVKSQVHILSKYTY